MIVRGGTVVTGRGVEAADIEIMDGRITAVGADLNEAPGDEIDATGLHIFPGGVDSHVHFNEPGRTDWETIATGSAALAAGGYTTFVDMPLNNLPVTTHAEAFDLKLASAVRSSRVDFGLWGGLVPGNVDRLEELAERGVTGFKAFMCPSGIDEFPGSDADVLRAGMEKIAEVGSILLVHAEDPSRLDPPNGPTARDFIRSRPADAELEAISQAIGIARDTGCRLHIVHVSTAKGVELIHAAQQRGVDVSGETCPHYLLYVQDDMERLGGIAKCAPPFRTALDREQLWSMLRDGRLPMVVSDHSPSTLDLKQGDDFSRIWGGISGCQSTRQLLLAKDHLELPVIAAATATNVAQRFQLVGKGDVALGYDADLSLMDLSYEGVVRREDLLYRNAFSVHEGQPIRGRTVRTMVRGRTVFVDGRVDSTSRGRLVRPIY